MPSLLLFCCLQTTGPREKPEEEKEDEVEGGAFHGLPQVPLRHIVTKLIISIIYHTRTHTCTHTHQQTFGCQGTPQQWSNYGSTKGTGGWLRNDSMDPGRMKLIWNVGLGPSRCLGLSATPAPLTIWSFSKVFLLSLRTSPHLYSSLKYIVI